MSRSALEDQVFESGDSEPAIRVLVLYLGRRGGLAHHTLETVRALYNDASLDPEVFLSRQCDLFDKFQDIGLTITAVDTYNGAGDMAASVWRLPAACYRLWAILRRGDIRAVYCTGTHLWNPFLAAVARSLGIKYVLTVHDGERHSGDRMSAPQWWLDAEVRRSDALITLSEHVKGQIVGRLRLPEDRVTVIPSGPYYAAAGTSRTAHGTPLRRLLFFGRIWPYKGLDLLLEAYASLKSRIPDLNLRIVGSGDFSPYRAAAAKLPDVEVDLRYVPEAEVPSILAAADVLVLPYREATQSGLVYLAAAARVPVVATPVGGLVEQLADGKVGHLASAVSSSAIAEAIEHVLFHHENYNKVSNRDASLWREAACKASEVLVG